MSEFGRGGAGCVCAAGQVAREGDYGDLPIAMSQLFAEVEKLALGSADLVEGGDEHGDAGPCFAVDDFGVGGDGSVKIEGREEAVLDVSDGQSETCDGGEDGFGEGFGSDG